MLSKLFPNNEHIIERVIRVVLGLGVLSLVFVGPHTSWGFVGLLPLVTGLIGSCGVYTLLGISTCRTSSGGGAPSTAKIWDPVGTLGSLPDPRGAGVAFAAGIAVQWLLTGHTGSLVGISLSLESWQRLLIPTIDGITAGLVLHFGRKVTSGDKPTDYMEALTVADGAIPVRPSLVKSASSLVTELASPHRLWRGG
jgi:hypothetical protein